MSFYNSKQKLLFGHLTVVVNEAISKYITHTYRAKLPEKDINKR